MSVTFSERVVSGGRGEDRALVIELGEHTVVIVADGAGGLGGGARAAERIIEVVRHRVVNGARALDCIDALTECDRVLAAVGDGQAAAVIAVFGHGGVLGASVGDCGALLVTPNTHIELTASQHRKPLLGSGAARPVAFAHVASADATLVVASDGLFAYAPGDALAEVVRGTTPSRLADALVALVRLPNGALQDDVAVVALRQTDG